MQRQLSGTVSFACGRPAVEMRSDSYTDKLSATGVNIDPWI